MPRGVYKRKPGIKYGMMGKYHSEKTKKRISKIFKGKHFSPITEFKKDNVSWCKGKKLPQISGSKNPNWRGGKIINSQGYILIYYPTHPFCDSHGYVRQHRLVMEKHLGRLLKPEERIHHKNDIKTDNRIENLELFVTHSSHTQYHFPKGSKFGINI